MEKSHVGYNNCYFCGEINEILLDKRLRNTLHSNMGVMNMRPCSKCAEYMKQGVIFMSISDDTTAEEMKGPIPNPYRTGGWIVVRQEAVERMFEGDYLKFALENRFAFITDSAWEKLGLPTYYDWVKKLGQWHKAEKGSSTTVCGMPMLGNNYASTIPETDRKKCEKCFTTKGE